MVDSHLLERRVFEGKKGLCRKSDGFSMWMYNLWKACQKKGEGDGSCRERPRQYGLWGVDGLV